MNPASFDPDKFIDRHAEKELFKELVSLEDTTRVMTVEDAGGRGKSSLMLALHYMCTWQREPQVPVSLIELTEDMVPFELVSIIAKQLAESFQLELPEFNKKEEARLNRDADPVRSALAAVQGGVNLTGGTVSGTARVGGIQLMDQASLSFASGWNPELEERARNACISAFIEDLREASNSQTIAILLDAYEKALEGNSSLHQFVTQRLMRPLCFDEAHRPASFILVVAGREVPNLKQMVPGERYGRIVKSHLALSDWELPHFRDFLKVHGHTLTDKQVDALYEQLSRGWSLSQTLRWAETLATW